MISRRARIVLLVLAVGIAALGIWAWEPVYWLLTTEKVYFGYWTPVERPTGTSRFEEVRGFFSMRSSDDGEVLHGWRVYWYVSSGFVALDELHRNGTRFRMTEYRPDGTVLRQVRVSSDTNGADEERTSPPWFWGDTAQTEPSIPAWMMDDEAWVEALEDQRR